MPSITPAQLLTVARFARPAGSWRVTPDGTVMDADGNMFSLDSRADREAVQFRLFDKGWRIKAVTGRGRQAYRAIRLNGSAYEANSFEALIVRCVGVEINYNQWRKQMERPIMKKALFIFFLITLLIIGSYFGYQRHLEKRYIKQMDIYYKAEQAKKNPPYTLYRGPGNWNQNINSRDK